jgi:hypothetical protein
VKAFAQQADPRLLPIILRHLQPDNFSEWAAQSLHNYAGKPEAARALIEHLRATKDLGEDRQSEKLIHEALVKIGTTDALQEAARLRQAKKLE